MRASSWSAEDGYENTADNPDGVTPCGYNGSLRRFVPDTRPGTPPPPSIAEKLAEQRLRFACQGAARPRA